jgi:two-component system sensor kinase
MNEYINILIVEDFPPDVELAEREINKTLQSCAFRLVETGDDYLAALEEFQPDIIISDYKLPRFDGLTALRLAQENAPLTPVIILTSAINEDTAVECMKRGATDYVIKEHIKRLGQAVVHALEERQLREERRRAGEALRASEERFRSLYENATVGIYRTTPEGRILMANPAAVRMLGYSSFDELAQHDLEKTGFEPFYRRIEFRQRLVREGVITGLESAWIKKDGSTIYVRESARAVHDGKGNILYYDGTFEDITEQKRAMEALTLLSHAVKSIGECISITDLENKLLFVNEAFLKTYGYTEQELTGKPINIIRSDPTVGEDVVLADTLKGGWQGELLNRKKNGTVFPIFLSTSVVSDEKGQPIALVGVATDITERKHTEEQLRASVKEKEVLLKETHHRVKNNLQVISSLLSLQSEAIKDQHDLTLFKESQDRIKSIALIHEQLYRSQSLSAIDFGEYVRILSTGMMRSYAREEITLNLDIAPVQFSLDFAIPCGLIINELLSNALKHAFPNGRQGNIRIQLKSDDDDKYVLTVMDNGIGLSEDIDLDNTPSLGLQLISTLTKQLQGKISMKRDNGTSISILFPKT